jgi:Delta24-sterol reductase
LREGDIMNGNPSKPAQFHQKLLEFANRYHGIIILIFCLPLSFLFDCALSFRNLIYWAFLINPKRHDKRVKQVQDQVIAWNKSDHKQLMCTARREWMTMSPRIASFKKNCHRIHINLHAILSIDTKNETVRLEPLVSMGQITRYLLPRGYALAIMVEMEDLTIGGLVMGTGIETSSHRLGLIQQTVVAYDIILGNGELVRASATENEDLFHALPWSHGTLGFLVAVELKIVPIKSYMRLTYVPCHSLDEMCKLTKELAIAEDGPNFLEVTVFSKEKSVIMCGDFADVASLDQKNKINHINYWFKPWFYKHVESFLTRCKSHEYIPLRHYYHRHSRSIFWELESLIPFGNHPLYRWLFGWLGAPKVSFIKLTSTKAMRELTSKTHAIEDFMLPIDELKNSILYADELFGIYPLLIFPTRLYDTGKYQGFLRKPEKIIPGKNYGMYFDLGIYGIPQQVKDGKCTNIIESVKKFEKYTRDSKGYQWLYADVFATEEEFKTMFDHDLYEQMRVKYKANHSFPTVYDKIK